MAFLSAQTLTQNSRFYSSDDVILSTDRQRPRPGQEDEGARYMLRIGISPGIAHQAGLTAGDRVDLLVDVSSRRCKIRRVESGGWKLGQSSANGSARRLTLKMTLVQGLPSVAKTSACKGIEVALDGLEFTVPDSASFTDNLRLLQERRFVS